ncbi:MAG: FAD-dependent oxidoreductase, partial [Oscillospiraceae bacterium]
VAGGGFAGCAAALAAARAGRRVLLLEEGGALGGAPAQNLVNPFMDWHTMVKQNGKLQRLDLSSGIFNEIYQHLAALGAAKGPVFHEEYLKLVLDRMLAKAGVTVLFHASVCQVKIAAGQLESLQCATSAGLMPFFADYFIDCTGDADLAAFSGCPFRLGRPQDELCQPMTLCFRVVNVNTEVIDRAEINRLYQQARQTGRIQNPREDVLIFNTMVNGMVHFNSTRIIKRSPVDIFDVSIAEMEAREQMIELLEYLKKEFAAFKNAQLATSAAYIGIRESRMIDGEYLLTEEDLKACVRFEDAIAAGNYDIDIHNPEGTGTSHYYFQPGEYYTIPYRSLVPQKATNLLVAGRCISATHEAQASIRIMPIVCTLGQAAGEAAALAYETGSPVSGINTAALQNRLKQNGAFVG